MSTVKMNELNRKTQLNKAQGGFTLIELMIVVTIVGILAAIAIPRYQDYTIRAQVSEGLSAASAARISVSEFYAINETLPSDNSEAGLDVNTSYATARIQSITVNDGDITLAFNELGGNTTEGQTIVYEPTATDGGVLEWACTAGTLPAQYRPAECRGAAGDGDE